MPLTASKILKVHVSDDLLTATASLNAATVTKALTTAQIQAELSEMGLVLDDQGKKNIEAFAAALAEGVVPEAIVIARGTAPVHDENGQEE